MARRSMVGLRVLVTGASSGIGKALVLELLRQQARVVAMARREDRLKELAQAAPAERFRWLAGDVTRPADRTAALALAEREFGGLDALVNNAGIGALGAFVEADEERLRRVMEVNFFAPALFIKEALPLLRKSNAQDAKTATNGRGFGERTPTDGRGFEAGTPTSGRGFGAPIIVNIGSVLGHRAVPEKSEYCASKFALHGLSDALRIELAREGIDVLLVSPSTTASEFFDAASGSASQAQGRLGAMRPEHVARRVVRAMRAGRREIILSAGGKLLVWLDRLCPPLADWIVGRFA